MKIDLGLSGGTLGGPPVAPEGACLFDFPAQTHLFKQTPWSLPVTRVSLKPDCQVRGGLAHMVKGERQVGERRWKHLWNPEQSLVACSLGSVPSSTPSSFMPPHPHSLSHSGGG